MKQFFYDFYKASFSSVTEVIDHMQHLQNELKNTDLQNVSAFNNTYLIITQNVYKKIGTGYFTYDDVMTNVDIVFASYYFNALKSYVEGVKTPPAWKILFDECKENSHHQFIYMALGVNAHVNNDLSQSLFNVVKNDAYKTDFDKVNGIIHKSIPEVINSLQEPSRLIATLEKVFLPVYTLFLDQLIKNWRADSWITYLQLKYSSTNVNAVEKKGKQLALQLRQVKHLYDIHHLRKIFL